MGPVRGGLSVLGDELSAGLSQARRGFGRLNIFQGKESRLRNRAGAALAQFEAQAGLEDPLLREWVRTADFPNLAVEDPESGRMMPVIDWLENIGGDEGWQALREGQIELIETRPEAQGSHMDLKNFEERRTTLGDEFAPGFSAARELGLTITLDPKARGLIDIVENGVNHTATRESARWGHNYPSEANR